MKLTDSINLYNIDNLTFMRSVPDGHYDLGLVDPPRHQCHNGNLNCNHERAPRGSKTGTQGRKNHYERSKIPTQLITEILNA